MVTQAPQWAYDERTGYYSDATSGRVPRTGRTHTRPCPRPRPARPTHACFNARMLCLCPPGSCTIRGRSSTTTRPLARGAPKDQPSRVRSASSVVLLCASHTECRPCCATSGDLRQSLKRGRCSNQTVFIGCTAAGEDDEQEEYPLNPFSSGAPPPPPAAASQGLAAPLPKVAVRSFPARVPPRSRLYLAALCVSPLISSRC